MKCDANDQFLPVDALLSAAFSASDTAEYDPAASRSFAAWDEIEAAAESILRERAASIAAMQQ